MARLKRNWICFILLMLDFYAVPWLIQDTGSGMFVMLLLIPFICFITSILYGLKNGLDIGYIMSVALLFLLSVPLFYNESALPYVVIYAAIALVGNLLALPFRKFLENH